MWTTTVSTCGDTPWVGRPYTVRGTVVKGDQRGRSLGFPTANIEPENEILPARGVYAGQIRLLDQGDPPEESVHPVVTNVGVRPTFAGSDTVVAEAHVIDFEGDLYGRRVDLSFLAHLREERKFPNVDALKTQIGADVAEARLRLEAL